MNYDWLTMQKTALLILSIFLLSSCIAENSAIKIAMKDKKKTASMSVSSVQIVNNQLVIHGLNLDEATDVSISGNSLSENFTIESKSDTQMIANARHGFSFDISKVFNLLISNAEASATFSIDFSLCHASLGTAGFDCTTPSNNDVLSFDITSNKWVPKALTGLSYRGTWNANTTEPTSTVVGQYYIVNVANPPTYNIGDWIIWDGSSYDIVAQSAAGGVSTVFGRPGAVVALEGDYNLDKLLDVDLTIPPDPGQVLKYVGGKWIAADDIAGASGGAGSVTTTELADGSVTGTKIAATTITNANISATAAIDYSKLNISAGAIAYAKLSIADGDIPAAKISGLPAALPSGGTTAQYFAGDKSLQTLNTAAVPESGTNYYFTDAKVRATTLTGLTSNTGTIAAADTVFGAFRKLLGTQGDYVSKSANTTVLGSITIDNTVGELHVPTLPTVGADLTQAASAGYVQNILGTVGQWIKTGSDVGYTAGNVAIGKAVPSTALDVVGQIDADSLLIRGEVGTFGWNGDVYTSSSTTSGTPDGTGVRVTNANDMDGALGLLTVASRNDAGTTQTFYIGSVSNTAGYTPTIVFGQQTGATAYNERMRISAAGNVGIGTSNPQAALTVAGTIASTPPAPFAGAAVDLSKSNTQVLTNVGQAAITLSNMVHGGSYSLIIQDTASRLYTFTGCASSKFQPANMATIALTHSIYNIMTVYNGTNYDCYITWSSGYN